MTHKSEPQTPSQELPEQETASERVDAASEPQSVAPPDEGAASERGDAADDRQTVQSQRKERVLHTRVPAVLEQELKRLATSLRMPVSNVVRAILEDAVTAVDVVGRRAEGGMNRVVDRMAEKRQQLRDITGGQPADGGERGVGGDSAGEQAREGEDPAADSRDQLAGVIGFQPLLLASSAACSVCGIELPAGTEAFVGVRDVPGPRVLIGPECLPKPRDE